MLSSSLFVHHPLKLISRNVFLMLGLSKIAVVGFGYDFTFSIFVACSIGLFCVYFGFKIILFFYISIFLFPKSDGFILPLKKL